MFNLMEQVNRVIDLGIRRLRSILTVTAFEAIERIVMGMANIGTLLAGVLGSLIALVLAVKMDSLSIFLGAFGWVLLLVILFYIGSKARTICATTLRNNPSGLASQELLDISIFITLIFCMGSALAGLYFAIKLSSLNILLIGLGGSVIMIYFLWLVLHPQLITTQVEGSSTAGIDGISYFVLGYKMYLRLSTILFGLLPFIGALLLFNTLFRTFGSSEELLTEGPTALLGFILVLSGLLSPWFIYLTFMLVYLIFDVLRAILLLGRHAQGGLPGLPSMEPASGAPAQTGMTAQAELPGPQISAKTLRNIVIGILAVVVAVTLVIKGKEWYQDFQAKREIARIEEERKKAQEELVAKEKAEQERLAAELKKQEEELAALAAQRVANLMGKVRRHLQKSSLDLLLEPDVNRGLREVLRTDDNMRAFEGYFAIPDMVTEADGLVVATGCRKDACEQLKAIFTIDGKTGQIGAAVNTRERLLYFGYEEADAPTAVKKWAISVR